MTANAAGVTGPIKGSNGCSAEDRGPSKGSTGCCCAGAAGWGTWNAETGQEILGQDGNAFNISSIVFSPDGKRIASGSWDKFIKVWDSETGLEMLTLRGHSDFVSSVSFSPNGKMIASGSYDKTLRLWDARPLEEDLQK